nr:hypothetical protein CFP56_53253 [Quercus suber]
MTRRRMLVRPAKPPADFDRPASWYNRYAPIVGSRLRISCHVDDFDTEEEYDNIKAESETSSVGESESPGGTPLQPLEESIKSMVAEMASETNKFEDGLKGEEQTAPTGVEQGDSQLSAVSLSQRSGPEPAPEAREQRFDIDMEVDDASTQNLDDTGGVKLEPLPSNEGGQYSETELSLHNASSHSSPHELFGKRSETPIDRGRLTKIAAECLALMDSAEEKAQPAKATIDRRGANTPAPLRPTGNGKRYYSCAPSFMTIPAKSDCWMARSSTPGRVDVGTQTEPVVFARPPSALRQWKDHSPKPFLKGEFFRRNK